MLNSPFAEHKMPSEQLIVSRWKGDIDRPIISICCITYNHEKYIEDALQGFLLQITDFPFEILINDDASQDRTTEIIRQYAEKYPRLIKPIFQKENKYSKGFKPNPSFNFPRVSGEFVAMCEGDDCWLSPNKLKRQYEIARSTGAAVVFHSAVELNMDTGEQKIVCRQRKSDDEITLVESVKGRGAYMPTASLFFPSKIIKERIHWFENDWPVGDFFLQMILSYEGRIFYLDEAMCLYRRNAPGSWTDKQKQKIESERYHKKMVSGIFELDNFLGQKKNNHLLAYPAFYYSKAYTFRNERPVMAIFEILSMMNSHNVTPLFKLVYLSQFIALPFIIIYRKILNFLD